MKVPILLQSILTGLGFAAILVAILLSLVMSCQRELKAVLDRFNGSRWTKRLLCVAAIGLLTCYAGFKHQLVTNPPPDDVSSPTNAPMMCAGSLRGRGLSQTSQVDQPSIASGGLGNPAAPVMFEVITNWTARGAYCDWQPVTFSDGFQFPVGTNFIDGVTLFAYGEIKSNLHCSTSTSDFDFSLPSRVSLEPGVSSVTHGLTPSNSYLFAWTNCCVERSATNRVDASIELFRNGAIETTVLPLSTNQPPTIIYQPPTPPEGFIGHGQDEAWIRATFPAESTNILAVGYNDWLLSTWTGINVENGHALVRVTIDPSAFNQPPTTINQPPIYLVCGPYRVNVTQPGTYAFPIEVLTAYDVRTYPTPVPLTFEYDDGYRGEGGPSFEVVEVPQRPRLMLAAPAFSQPPTTNNQLPSCIYQLFMTPNIVVTPSLIALADAVGDELHFWCNVANRAYTFIAQDDGVTLSINGARAVIRDAWLAGLYEVRSDAYDEEVKGYFELYGNSPTNESGFVTNRIDATIFCGDTWHTETVTNRYTSHHLTAVTQYGSTEPVTESMTQTMAEGVSAYVAVYMATTEPDSNPAYDDSISWSVTSNGGGSLSGSTGVFDSSSALANAVSWNREIYGVEYDPLFLGGQMFTAPADDVLRLSLTATAQNATDGLRETCVQIVVYPVDGNGNIIGLPSWAHPSSD